MQRLFQTVEQIVEHIDNAVDTVIVFLKQTITKPQKAIRQKVLVNFIFSVVFFLTICLCTLNWTDFFEQSNTPNSPNSVFLYRILNKYLLYYPVILLHVYVLIPRFWKTKHYFTYLLFIPMLSFYCYLISPLLFRVSPENQTNYFQQLTQTNYFIQLTSVLIAFVISGSIQYIYEDFAVSARMLVLERRNNRLLLENYKLRIAQLKPHFLLNSLNNIDALMHKRTEKARESLQNLSEVLKYLLYDTEIAHIRLTKEIIHVKSIVELKSLSFIQPLQFKCVVTGNPNEIKIPPLLLTPLIENSLKWMNPEDRWLNVVIDIGLSEVIFTISNSKSIKKDTKIHAGGLGLKHLNEHLTVLYPNETNLLQLNDYTDFYQVILKIPFQIVQHPDS
jgi:sensor histidine kinase YesM